MSQRQLIFSFVLTTILAYTLHSQSTPEQSLLALSKKDQTLAIVDPSSLKVLARIPVGNDPHEVIASTDGKTAYVSNYGFGAYNSLGSDRPGREESAARNRSWSPSWTARLGLHRGQGMVHRGGRQSDRQLRSEIRRRSIGFWAPDKIELT